MAESIPNYNFKPPTREDAIASLTRLLGEAAALDAWEDACVKAGVSKDSPSISEDELSAVAQQLSCAEGLTSVVGTSLFVNLRTYKALSRLKRATSEN